MKMSYRYVKLFKFPSCVGIVPDNWLVPKFLFHFGFGFWWKLRVNLKKSPNVKWKW